MNAGVDFNDSNRKRAGIFRFDRKLTEKPEITELVKDAWSLTGHNQSTIPQLDLCRSKIIEWLKVNHANSQLQIKQNQQELETALSSQFPDQVLITSLSKKLEAAYKEEESYWKQRSRVHWLQEGDRNTAFFHAVTRGRRTLNAFSVIEDDQGTEFFDEDQIADVISQVFKGTFSTNGNSDFHLVEEVIHQKVDTTMNDSLIGHPSAQEIKEAVFSINASKAPGPDGFSSKFYQAYWHIIGEDVSREIQAFFESSELNTKHNETHIIAKILTKRIQPILPSLISPHQSAFVPNRAISDNVLITHEVLHYLRTSEAKKFCSMAVKTDMSKAYDRIEWGFLQAVLLKLGLHEKWVAWVMACVTSVSYKFLINGAPKGHVIPTRGLRQGDPLSPYLFILCTEVLSGLCSKAQSNGTLPGIKVARASPPINHLLFADDTMFFCKSSPVCCSTLTRILEQYEKVSGQCINLTKSAITFSSKTSSDTKAKVKDALKINQEGGIGKYLGLPEHFGRKKRDIFSSIVDKIRQRAHSWSSRFLSGAGKQVLLKAVLQSMPSYAMSCFKLPSSLCKQIHSVLTRFWWDDKPGKKKMCWVAWDKLTKPKFDGGLGFKDVEAFNDAFLAKIGWRILHNPSSLLAKILLGKYCHSSSFLDCKSPSSASHGWRGILIGRDLLKEGLGWSIGNGNKVRIWQDPWLSLHQPQVPIGPPTFNTYSMLVKDLLCPLTQTWNPAAIRDLLPQYEDTIRALNTSFLGLQDTLVWFPEKSGQYSTKSGYIIAKKSSQLNSAPSPSFNWNKVIWQIKAGPKIKSFLWKTASGALSLGSNLEKRGLSCAKNCCRCGEREDELHLLWNCPFAQRVWQLAPLHLQISSASLVDLLSLLRTASSTSALPPTGLSLTPLAPWILWNLWKARNYLIFEDRTFSEQDIVLKAIKEAKDWQAAQSCLPNQALKRKQCSPPPVNSEAVKCFVDAAWCGSTKLCGQGWIVYDPSGNAPIRYSVSQSFVSSALSAEALALRSALFSLCQNLACSHDTALEVYSDCQVLTSTLNSKACSKELNAILLDITSLSESFMSISFNFVPRLDNVVADSLAKSTLVAAKTSSVSRV
ncbi:Ribonuclease H domain [Arabidopsis thaliana x Arabidopsis arenosa]|uniref:Ribonuclease H domain n=1 Tax=Arabidopsis thaliana x Arabidopsis arenosa TaxID=1240361 RepID=A0A8T2BC81_9BRAS|nr:Ribonuclease H domain [Arabidopsis thaliana x Arabidopsis arenosa]